MRRQRVISLVDRLPRSLRTRPSLGSKSKTRSERYKKMKWKHMAIHVEIGRRFERRKSVEESIERACVHRLWLHFPFQMLLRVCYGVQKGVKVCLRHRRSLRGCVWTADTSGRCWGWSCGDRLRCAEEVQVNSRAFRHRSGRRLLNRFTGEEILHGY